MVKNDNVFFIAEAGVNHNGNLELALELVNEAFKAGADAVKFQTFKADKLVKKGTAKVKYQKLNDSHQDQYQMLKSLELDQYQHNKIISLCKKLKIQFMSTPFDVDSANFLVQSGMRIIKIPSGEITNFPLIENLTTYNVPIILSTGMSTLLEVSEAVSFIKKCRKKYGLSTNLKNFLTLLHCTSNYPTSLKDVNLRAMITLKNKFALPVGYSDHTEGILISIAAASLGANVIEKHFTLDRSMPGPDHLSSIEPSELKELIKSIRSISVAMGLSEKKPVLKENIIKKQVRRSITLIKKINKNEVFSSDHLLMLRPGYGIEPKFLKKVIGKKAARNISPGTTLKWKDIID